MRKYAKNIYNFLGILVVDKSLDRLREWGKLNGVKDSTNWEKRDCWLDLRIQFRPSQKKFKAPRANQKLEIVKYSSPVPISLNRPVNNILDQVKGIRIVTSYHEFRFLHLKVRRHISEFAIASTN